MEGLDITFSVRIQIGPSAHMEDKVVGRDIVNQYDGCLSVFKDPFEINWLVKNSEL